MIPREAPRPGRARIYRLQWSTWEHYWCWVVRHETGTVVGARTCSQPLALKAALEELRTERPVT